MADLEMEQDLEFQRLSWKIERAAWLVMALLMIGGLLGAFGSGPLSRVSTGETNKLQLEYERFGRYESPSSLKIHLKAPAESEEARIKISRSYFDAVRLERIIPEPVSVRVVDGWLDYTFKVDAPATLSVKVDVTTQTFGRVEGTVASQDGAQLSFYQFIYP